jgi:hypothetical protein
MDNNNQRRNYQLELNNILRQLWQEHVMWTRSFIISTAANLGDLPYVTERLLRNPGDFTAVLEQFYGPENAQRFQQLFTDHLTLAAQLVNDSKAGNTAAADSARQKWYANADEIAAFLASLNPYWNQQEWQTMLYDHLAITEQEAGLRLSGRYAEDVALYDEIEAQALEMVDYMTQGLSRQFRV